MNIEKPAMTCKTRKQFGFTIVELLIVIVVIGIIAAITISAYSGSREEANKAKKATDTAAILNAIHIAHLRNENMTLQDMTGYNFSIFACSNASGGGNPGNVEPRDLPKTHECWTTYYDVLQKLDYYSGENLYEQLKSGDARGNPYLFDENEGEYPENPCRQDYLFAFDGNGTADYTRWERVPFTLAECL